jgi:TorA maturation chaperone TorD
MKIRKQVVRKPALGKRTRRWLDVASGWRLLSLLFQSPTRELRRELNRLTTEGPKKLAPLAREWAETPRQEAEAEFLTVFGPGGIPAVESSYDPNALAGRGPLLADIAGFHEAFAYRPARPPAAVPDHIAVELDFLSYMAFKTAFAVHARRRDESKVAAQAYERFLEEHLCTWVGAFRERLQRSASPFYARAALSVAQMVRMKHAG